MDKQHAKRIRSMLSILYHKKLGSLESWSLHLDYKNNPEVPEMLYQYYTESLDNIKNEIKYIENLAELEPTEIVGYEYLTKNIKVKK